VFQEVDHRVVEGLDGPSNPVRYQICAELHEGESTTSAKLADAIGRNQSNISQHLKILKDLNLVASKRAGNTVHYRIRREDIVKHILKLGDNFSRP